MTAGPSREIEPLRARDIFARGRYVVPVYQRAYAWGESQILTLLQDVSDYRRRKAASYYIGALVTHRGPDAVDDDDVFEVVDGQQRLTTLFIILSILTTERSERPPAGVLAYEGRGQASRDLAILQRDGDEVVVGDLQVAGIRIAVEAIRSAWESKQFTPEDLTYLVDHVKIARTTLPTRTDLNHYFEVMNSRGEQLEKHEIVKAHLMSLLAESESAQALSRAFALTWDACSDMSRHVQARFPADVRTALFGAKTGGAGWDTFLPHNFHDVVAAIGNADGKSFSATALSAIIGAGTDETLAPTKTEDEAPERYGAIIDFPNFLLHVLALSEPSQRGFSWEDTDSADRVSLDDKKLVEQFETRVTSVEQAETFAFTLLKMRYLFDKYVIRTDLTRLSDDDSNWVLVRVRAVESKLSPVGTFRNDDVDATSSVEDHQRHIVMLQSMFQVTDSRRAYKNFLYAILEYLSTHNHPNPLDYIAFMQRLARDRYVTAIGASRLDDGTSVPHFALNYLDYLLWADVTDTDDARLLGVDRTAYRFRYRTSIEHFYPQHPDPDSQIPRLTPDENVDQFGNLCIMTRSENSQRSNLAPAAKVEQYRSERQTLKFQIMAAITKRDREWTTDQMEAHGIAMRSVLETATQGEGSPRI